MIRVPIAPRPDWRNRVEARGLLFHTIDGEPYWDESGYYLFESAEIDRIEQATLALDAMCLEAVDAVIADGRLGDFGIPAPFHRYVEQSWEVDEHTIYGRFDLCVDPAGGPPKLLEYNADTPTALLEAAVIQWFWAQDVVGSLGAGGSFDQFNSLHERLIEAWGRVRRELGTRVVFAAVGDAVEDVMTATYLRDTAVQAGLQTESLDVSQIGWHAGRRCFTDLREQAIPLLFKLYPWEWMLREAFGRNLPVAQTRWLEPPWKMILSSKAILPILSDMFPDSPYILRASFEQPRAASYVVKPIHSREGANVRIVDRGRVVAETDGEYGDGPVVYQEYVPLPVFDGRRPVVGSWMVNGNACGLGIREDDGPITGNTSRFLPHLIRRSPTVKPPGGQPKPAGSDRSNPLYDPWVDPA